MNELARLGAIFLVIIIIIIIIIIITVIMIVGRAKRAPHWGVQSRFRVIYMCRFVCPPYAKNA